MLQFGVIFQRHCSPTTYWLPTPNHKTRPPSLHTYSVKQQQIFAQKVLLLSAVTNLTFWVWYTLANIIVALNYLMCSDTAILLKIVPNSIGYWTYRYKLPKLGQHTTMFLNGNSIYNFEEDDKNAIWCLNQSIWNCTICMAMSSIILGNQGMYISHIFIITYHDTNHKPLVVCGNAR